MKSHENIGKTIEIDGEQWTRKPKRRENNRLIVSYMHDLKHGVRSMTVRQIVSSFKMP